MILKFVTTAIIINFSVTIAQNRDVKFYNLEKEYSKTLTYVYKVKQAKALELKLIVKDMLSIFGSLYVNEKSNELYITDVEEKIADLRVVLPGLDAAEITAGNNLISRLFRLNHEHAGEIITLVRHKLSPEGNVYEVPTLNGLVISDVQSKIDEVMDLISQLDVPSPMISIEITVIEFNNEYFSKLGLNIFDWIQSLSVGASIFARGRDQLNTSIDVHSQQSYSEPDRPPHLIPPEVVSRPLQIKAGVNVGDIVNFINENAQGSVLANSRLITRNNKEAFLTASEVLPFRMYENESSEQNPAHNVALTGTNVRVIPTVQQDSMINLKIDPSISDLTGWSPKGMPIVFQRSLRTEVKVLNNSVFALGGLTRREKTNIRRGVPVLKSIPFLRYFFSVEKKVELEREVMIFIKPSLFNSRGEAVEYAPMQKKFKGKP